MNPDEIQNLKEENEELRTEVEQLKRKDQDRDGEMSEIKRILESHTHSGNDGTKPFYNETMKLKTGSQVSAGYVTLADQILPSGATGAIDDVQRGALVVGKDEDLSDGFDNAQLTIEHQEVTDGGTNQTFLWGIRGKGYAGDTGEVTSGGTTLDQANFTFVVDRLTGHFIAVYNPSAPTEFDVYEIASNTATQITITGGTWTFNSANDAKFFIWVPMYSGAAQYPWRRIYTMEGTAGGVRFGGGDTAGGQNGMLYMDSTGDLYWRSKAGVSTKLN